MLKFQNHYEYLRQLERSQVDELTKLMHKHLSSLLESVKNHGTHLKIHFQWYQSIAHNVSEIFCVILGMKYAITHLKNVIFVTFCAI